ncbi:hypothetical protein F4680DRAFT_448006 [Xylaria scruposa]|nr:hypothetical protein F4680DRAFT_448006 [Xylaria scruposa]
MSYYSSVGSVSDPFAQYRTNPTLGFRVEFNGNSTFRGSPGSMIPRDPERGLDYDAFRDHFDWSCRSGGPFISFFGEWTRVMRWRRRMVELRKRNVVVIAVWLDGLEVFDASGIARDLGCPELSWYENEYLLHGGIHGEQHRILAKFRGDDDLEPVTLSFKDLQFGISLPRDFIRSLGITGSQDIAEAIKREVYSLTGDETGVKFEYLLYSMCGLI